MSVQWIHNFIDSRILDHRFTVEEFDNFRAKIVNCSVPIFQNMTTPWDLVFDTDGDIVTWSAIDYEDEDDPHGILVMNGTLGIEKTNQSNWYPDELDIDSESSKFIEQIFTTAKQVSVRQVYQIEGNIIDFDYMKMKQDCIRFTFHKL